MRLKSGEVSAHEPLLSVRCSDIVSICLRLVALAALPVRSSWYCGLSFGYICSAVGHFPVLFTSSKANDFAVDKEAQAKVTEQLDQFIGSGGGLVIFPEGQLNSTPRKLQQFRRGTSSHACSYASALSAQSPGFARKHAC